MAGPAAGPWCNVSHRLKLGNAPVMERGRGHTPPCHAGLLSRSRGAGMIEHAAAPVDFGNQSHLKRD